MKRSLLICLLLIVRHLLPMGTNRFDVDSHERGEQSWPYRNGPYSIYNLPKTIFKSYTPSDRHIIEAKLREFTPQPYRSYPVRTGAADGHDDSVGGLSTFLQSLHADALGSLADGARLQRNLHLAA